MFSYGLILGFIICFVLFELVRKGYFKWVGHARVTHDAVKKLVKECSTWAILSQQDKSQMLAMTHSNYAVAQIHALHQIATPEFIFEATNVHIDKLESEVYEIQKKAANNLIHQNPEISPPGDMFNKALQEI